MAGLTVDERTTSGGPVREFPQSFNDHPKTSIP
jgi:hypothetical protein